MDRADSKGFVLLAIDTTPGYTDTQPFRAPAKWIYQAIYRVGDNRVGQWSNPVSIAVGASCLRSTICCSTSPQSKRTLLTDLIGP